MIKSIKISCLFWFCIILFGCANQKEILGKNEHYPTISITMFHNDSFEPGLEEKLTNLTIEEFLADGRLPVENDSDSELTIRGSIKKYTKKVLALDSNDNVSLYQLAVSVDINVLDTRTLETVAHYSNINVNTTYVPQRSDIEFETETDAQQRLMEDLAEEIVYQLVDKDRKILIKRKGD